MEKEDDRETYLTQWLILRDQAEEFPLCQQLYSLSGTESETRDM